MKRRRIKTRNYPLAVKYKGRRLTFRELVDRFGIGKAASIYRKLSKSYSHGRLLFEQTGKLKRVHPDLYEPKWAARKVERILRSRFAGKKKTRKAKAKKSKAGKSKKLRSAPKAKKAKTAPKAKAKKSTKRTKAAQKVAVKAAKKAKVLAEKSASKKVAKKRAKSRKKAAAKRAAKKAAAPKLSIVKTTKSVPGWPAKIDANKLAAVKGSLGKSPSHVCARVAGMPPSIRLKTLRSVAPEMGGVLSEKSGVQIRGYGKGTQRLSWGEFLQYVLYLAEGPQRPKSQMSVVDMMRASLKKAKSQGGELNKEWLKQKEEQISRFVKTAAELGKKLGRTATTDEIASKVVPEAWKAASRAAN